MVAGSTVNTTQFAAKIKTCNNITAKLGNRSWGASAATLRSSSATALCYSVAE